MYIGLSKTDVVKLTDIIRVEYDETMNLTFFHLSSGGFVSVGGRSHYDTYTNFLILSRNLLFIQDLVDRKDNLDKVMAFHNSDPSNNHEIIQALDNAEELIKKATEAKARMAKLAPAGQLDFDFPIDSENILN